MWNCFRKQHRTTNIVESWHHRKNNILGNLYLKLVDLIRLFKKKSLKIRQYFHEDTAKSGRKEEEEGTPKSGIQKRENPKYI